MIAPRIGRRTAERLAVASSIIVTFGAAADVVQTSGPAGGSITALAQHGASYIAGTRDGGISRSVDGGNSWMRLEGGFPTLARVTGVVAAGRAIFVGTEQDAVFRSLDNGDTWSPADVGLAEPGVRQIIAKGATLFVLNTTFVDGNSLAGGLFRSDDGGQTWTPLPNAFQMTAIGASSQTLFGSVNGAPGIARSSDQGEAWEFSDPGSPVSEGSFSAFTVEGGTVYAGRFDQTGVYRSDDEGLTWARVDTDLPETLSVTTLAIHGVAVLAALTHPSPDALGVGLYRSFDGGVHWSLVTGLPGGQGQYVLSFLSSGPELLVGSEKGVFRSDGFSDVWQPANEGLIATQVQAVIAAGETLYAAVAHKPPGFGELVSSALDRVFRSSDGGATWSSNHVGLLDGCEVKCLLAHGASLFAGTDDDGIFRSDDGGLTWSAVNNGLPQFLALGGMHYREISVMADHGNVLFAGTGAGLEIINGLFQSTSGGVYRSLDNGGTWTKASDGIPIEGFTNPPASTPIYSPITALAHVNGIVFAGTQTDGIFKTLNDGVTWSAANGGLPQNQAFFPICTAFAAMGADIFAAAHPFAVGGGGSGVFRSSDRGNLWTAVSDGLPPGRPVNTVVAGCNELYAAVGCSNLVITGCTLDPADGVYRSSDAGATWVLLGGQLSGIPTGPLALSGVDLFAGTLGLGVWRSAVSSDINGNGLADPCESLCDADADGDADLLDFAVLAACLTGPGGGAAPACVVFDVEPDVDVDLVDVAFFQAVFTGP